MSFRLEGDREAQVWVGCSKDNVDSTRSVVSNEPEALVDVSASSSDDMGIEDPVSELSDDVTSELASVYLVFTISSSKGVRKETFFSA